MKTSIIKPTKDGGDLFEAVVKTIDRIAPIGSVRRKVVEFLYSNFLIRFSSYGVKKRAFDAKLTSTFSPLSFPQTTEPEVSIVIPVYNKFIYTYNCLKAVLEHTGDIKYEVIIVDNASTDKTAGIVSIVKNITVIKNKENRGFVGACNQGARKAKGKYILFLNNDTKVQDGWLEALVEAAKKDGRVGAVGAKLIYPDGTLQEAGGIVWNDEKFIAWNYGRNKDPYNYKFNYLKEVDYCSAACLLVRRGLFIKLGGFDSRYAPAYSEDTDLAFNIRKAGCRLVYQPKAEVVHFEGKTAGTHISKGVKRYQEINTKKLYKKWKTVIEKEHFRNGEKVFLARDRSQGKKVFLFIDNTVPTYNKDAGSLTIYMYLKLLVDMGFKVVFAPDSRYKIEPYTTELQQMGVEVIYGPVNIKKWIKLYGKYIDYAWLSRPQTARRYIDTIKKYTGAKVLYYTHDLHYIREQRRYEVEKERRVLKEAERLRRTEFYIFEHVDTILTPSDEEVSILKPSFPDKEIINIPVFFYDEVPPRKHEVTPFNKRANMMFLGGFAHLPNIDAVKYFIKDIFPRVKEKVPDIKFYVVGSNPPEDIRKLDSEDVVVTGFVDDLARYFEKTRVFVSPLRYGAGLKGKIVTSMSYGVPVVTTAIGNEGLGLTDGNNAMLSDGPGEFAQKVVELYTDQDLWKKLSQNSIDFVRSGFSRDIARGCIKGALGLG